MLCTCRVPMYIGIKAIAWIAMTGLKRYWAFLCHEHQKTLHRGGSGNTQIEVLCSEQVDRKKPSSVYNIGHHS